MPVNPNPQGKGLVPVLGSLEQHTPLSGISPKQIDQIAMELFTSMFVLQSDMKFNPVPGNAYWLYLRDDRYRLLMVEPERWGSVNPGRFIGRCLLHDDRTWSLQLADEVAADDEFMQDIEDRQRRFQQDLEQSASVENMLPDYDASLGFYGKVLAYSLGRSLDISMQLSGIRGLSYREASGLLTHSSEEGQG